MTQVTGSTTSITPTRAAPQVSPEMKKAAQAFEAVFLRQMIGAMRSASLDEGLGDSSATEQFRDLADARTADSMSQGHGLGIAEMLMRQFSGSTPSNTATAATATTDTQKTGDK